MYTIVALGNPGLEYETTRHNAGRIVLEHFHKKHSFPEWKLDTKRNARIAKGTVSDVDVVLIEPETQMNRSGNALTALSGSPKKISHTIVLHDDIDLPFGTIKISQGRGAGGHRGIASIIKKIDSKDFVRIRIGITPQATKGKLKKPKGEDAVINFILGAFSKKELGALTSTAPHITDILETIIGHGVAHAMNRFN